jgi:hypothetical protein
MVGSLRTSDHKEELMAPRSLLPIVTASILALAAPASAAQVEKIAGGPRWKRRTRTRTTRTTRTIDPQA